MANTELGWAEVQHIRTDIVYCTLSTCTTQQSAISLKTFLFGLLCTLLITKHQGMITLSVQTWFRPVTHAQTWA